MSESDGGPRVWNRADVETVLRFVGHIYGEDDLKRAMRLMVFVETFSRTTVTPPAPNVTAALAPEPGTKQGGWTPERRAAQAERMRKVGRENKV